MAPTNSGSVGSDLPLNRWADGVLDTMSSVGALYGNIRKNYLGTETNIFSTAGGVAQIQVGAHDQTIQNVIERAPFMKDGEEFIERVWQPALKPSLFVRGMARAGGAFDAATGVLSALETFSEERAAGDNSYKRTLASSIQSTAQLGLGTWAGIGVATAAATVFAAPAAVVLAGAAVGAGVAYGVGKLGGYAREWFGF